MCAAYGYIEFQFIVEYIRDNLRYIVTIQMKAKNRERWGDSHTLRLSEFIGILQLRKYIYAMWNLIFSRSLDKTRRLACFLIYVGGIIFISVARFGIQIYHAFHRFARFRGFNSFRFRCPSDLSIHLPGP